MDLLQIYIYVDLTKLILILEQEGGGEVSSVENITLGTENNEPSINNSNCAIVRDSRLEGKFVSQNVINLSRRNLSAAEISLLSKGLKFVPTANRIDRAKLKTELEQYGRKLRLMWHFRNDEKTFSADQFKPKSTFNPKNKDAIIETYLSCLEERLLDIEIPSKRFNNLTKEERDALYSLKNDSSIIIKGADKGSAVVVWDREDYVKEAEKQLEDKAVYEEFPNDPEALVNTILKTLDKIRRRGDLSTDNLNYFLVKDPKFARFYLLPKIHKRLHDVPGRPVISNCGYYTENISSFLDYHLQPLAQGVKSFIKDTKHFLQKLRNLGKQKHGAILCTIDVVGLYPNIPHEEGLASLRKFLDSRIDKKVTTETLVELAELVLKNNIFQFDEKLFKQVRGTAIGTKFAPPYAILFLANLEEKILGEMDLKPRIWWRYIDDIFFIWEHGEEELKEFIKKLNEYHPTIKFTAEWSKEEISFLDVKVSLKEGDIKTDLFVKSTDTHQFLEPTSCHPYHCKKGIPYSQALRYNRICSDNVNFDKRCNELEGWLLEQGYNEKMVRSQILKAREKSRENLLENVNTRSSEQKLTFNITYYPVFQNVRNILEELHILLAPDKEHRKVFPEIPVVGFRNGKSLKDHLVRAVLPKINKSFGSEPCGKSRCQVCNYISTTDRFTTKTSGETFKIKDGPLNCDSDKVLYLLKCNVCDEEAPYVGKSYTKFRLRFNNYKSKHRSFRKGNNKQVPQKRFHSHYSQHDHDGIDNWSFTLIEQCDTHEQLKQRETFWQHRLKTFYPLGLNEKEEYLY